MAEVKNIKDLKQTDTITSGDYVLIETSAGTNLIDFENFIIDEDNTTFASDMQTDIIELRTGVESVTADVDVTQEGGALNIVNTSLNTQHSLTQDTLYGEDRISVVTTAFFHGLTGETEEFTMSSNMPDFIDDGVKFAKYDLPAYELFEPASTLQALSARVLSEAFGFVKILSGEVFGDVGGHLHGSDVGSQLDTASWSYEDWTPENNPGGIIKAVMDGVESLGANVQTQTQTLNTGISEHTFTFTGLANYDVDIASASFTQYFSLYSTAIDLATTTSAYSDGTETSEAASGINNLVTTGYEAVKDSAGALTGVYKWSIKLVGGTAPDATHPVVVTARLVAKRTITPDSV